MASATLAQFNAQIDKWIGVTVPAKAVAFQKKIHFMVLGAAFQDAQGNIRMVSGLLQMTPVDTGRARGNWQSSAGAPAVGTIEGFPKSTRKRGDTPSAADFIGGPPTPTEQEAAAAGLSGLAFGQTSYITNNLPYIAILNDGGVNRVAHHMVERAVANVRSVLAAG
jgi:hypothetical protein